MTAYERGKASYHKGLPIEANPYERYYMRRHPYSGWRSEVSNPAWWEWNGGYGAARVEAVMAAIRTVLTKRGALYELEFGLAVMAEYAHELNAATMRDAVRKMLQTGELSDKFGVYKLKTTQETPPCDQPA